MNILLKYDYVPHTTAEYIRKVAEQDHFVFVVNHSNNINEIIKEERINFLFEIESNGVPIDAFNVNVSTAVWLLDTHLNLPLRVDRAKVFDYVFCPHKQHIDELNACWLPYACEPSIHKDHNLERIYDITFIGHVHRDQYGNSYPIHDDRLGLLNFLRENFNLNWKENIYFDEMAKEYSQSKIIFNHSVRNDINMRLFEAMSCGGCLVTNELTESTGIGELFPFGTIENIKPDSCFLTYKNGEDLKLIVEMLLQEDKLREKIAENGYKAIKNHTYKHRLDKVLAVING